MGRRYMAYIEEVSPDSERRGGPACCCMIMIMFFMLYASAL